MISYHDKWNYKYKKNIIEESFILLAKASYLKIYLYICLKCVQSE